MTLWRTDAMAPPSIVISGKVFRAVLFDLDGVVTDTARVHRSAWRRLFHELTQHGDVGDVELSDEDYRRYIDGKLRAEGLQSYLDSRQAVIPPGTPDDSPDAITIGNLLRSKDRYFLAELDRRSVEVIVSTVRWIQELRSAGVRTALVSASRNARYVLESAKLADYFDIRLDGVDAAKLGLQGKPDPETYVEAAHRLKIPPSECVVVEDAIAGIQAAHHGGFGLCIGLGPEENLAAMTKSGADLAVTDLGQVDYHFVTEATAEADNYDPGCEVCANGSDPSWSLEY